MNFEVLFSSMATGAVAGAAAEILTHPIYTVKNTMETSRKKLFASVELVLKSKGVGGFYSGVQFSTTRQIFSTGARFGFYRPVEAWVSSMEAMNSRFYAAKFLSGAISGLVSNFVVHPFDVLCITAQRAGVPITAGLVGPTIRERLAKEGIAFVYSGFSVGFLRNFLVGALVFPLNDAAVHLFKVRGLDTAVYTKAVAPITASLIATSIIQPIDFVKTRWTQKQPLWFGWNPRTYYRGWSMNMLRVVPHFFTVNLVIQALTAPR